MRTTCLCGLTEATSFGAKDELELAQCACGVVRRLELDAQDYMAQYMNGSYHNDNAATVIGQPIKDRFEHDFALGVDRLRQMAGSVSMHGTLLDVGCGNGAFVQAALDAGLDAYGIDLYLPPVARERLGGRVEVAELADCRFTRRTVDVLVLNDVIEHVLDPAALMRQAAGIIKRSGVIVVDTPDFTELAIANHHVKPREHIWYLEPRLWKELFAEAGLICRSHERPIDGKIVFYLQDDQRELEVTVRGPTGLGDVHWILLKVGALKAAEAPCRLTLAIPGNGDPELIFRAKGFLELLPFLDKAKIEIGPPVIIDSGADDVTKPTYNWIANSHLERGCRIEDWNPHLEVDFNYPVRIPAAARDWALDIKASVRGPLVVFYASSKAWNHAVTAGNAWGIKEWADLTARLLAARIRPVLMGKHWDQDYAAEFARASRGGALDLTGKTTEGQALALMAQADAVIGMCAGITILGVHLSAPSIVFWPEVGKGTGAPMQFHPDFARNWVDPEQLASGRYLPLALGAFGVADIVNQLKVWGVM